MASGEVRSVHARVGRAAVVLFDVPSHEALHRRLNGWAEIIPAQFTLYPLLEPIDAKGFLAGAGRTGGAMPNP